MTRPKDPARARDWRARKNARRHASKPLTTDPPARARLYNHAFPDRPPLASTPEWVVGTWQMGSCWSKTNGLYGAYPRSYLQRVHSMFPEVKRILHAFSGGLTAEVAVELAQSYLVHHPIVALVDLVDDDHRHPTFHGDVCDLPKDWSGYYDIVLADPPYSAADAEAYGTPMPNRAKVMRSLRRVTRMGGNLVWLDAQWPIHRKDEWRTWGQVGVVRSTNHRVRLCTMFEAV